MCDFKPGDEVVCVNAAPLYNLNVPNPCLVEGRVYRIKAVVLQPFRGDYGVLLENCPTPWQQRGGVRKDCGFNPSRFRKVQRPKTDLSIEAFLTIKPGFEEPKRVKERVKA